ncbi:MAG: hypothetical protein JWR35_3930 [Marmoricola sp.]|nr:hypothetical protein [Marmoricola sp.]
MTETKTQPSQNNWLSRARSETSFSAQYGYIPALDGLRLLAVTIVVIRHFDISDRVPGGFGVSIFFFISGFLITRLLLAEEKKYGKIGLGNFYIRRFIRLLPPLLLMGAVAIPVLFLIDADNFAWNRVILSFTYLGNLSELTVIFFHWDQGWGELGPLWSLAVEEHFYLLLPPLLLALKRPRSRLVAVAAVVVVPLILRLAVYATVDAKYADPINYLSTPMRLDALAWGVLLTLLLDDNRLRSLTKGRTQHLLVWGGCLAMFFTLFHWSSMYEIAIKYTPQSIAIGTSFLGVLFAHRYLWLRIILEFPPIRYLGSISYEIYLWHALIFTLVTKMIGTGVGPTFMATVLSVVVSDAAFRLTTKRLRSWRTRFGGHPV